MEAVEGGEALDGAAANTLEVVSAAVRLPLVILVSDAIGKVKGSSEDVGTGDC